MRRWGGRLAGFFVAVLIGLALLTTPMACTTTVVPPAEPSDPAPVVLVDHGRHASVLLPRPDGGMTRYAYGDWNWYALGNTGPLNAVGAMLIPTQGALGRHALPAPVEPGEAQRALQVVVEEHWHVPVERSRALALQQRLDRIHRENADTSVRNRRTNLNFVPHPDRYSSFHNSNHVAADWLRELGCEVRGPAFSSDWRVETPGGESRFSGINFASQRKRNPARRIAPGYVRDRFPGRSRFFRTVLRRW